MNIHEYGKENKEAILLTPTQIPMEIYGIDLIQAYVLLEYLWYLDFRAAYRNIQIF